MTSAKQAGKRWSQRSVVLSSLAAVVLEGCPTSQHEHLLMAGGPHQDPSPAPVAGSGQGADEPGVMSQAPKPTIYICPMHPDERSTKPGRCPRCGMNLVPTPREGS